MMGTLQIFAGLITFLFVASGDTPKVPYQTRLDLFMLWSFMNVALMLFIHGTLYWWRECDVEDLLKERDEEKIKAHREKSMGRGSGLGAGVGKTASIMPQPHADDNSVEMGVASPSVHHVVSSPASPSARVYVNDHEVAPPGPAAAGGAAGADVEDPWWRVRYHEWTSWNLVKWFQGLHLTRKWDAVCIPGLMIIYSVGAAVILGREVHKPEHAPS